MRVSVQGEIATIVLNRPHRLNAQTPGMWTELARVGAELSDNIRVVVVRGAGRAFSAGLDRSAIADERLGGPTLVELASLPAEECDAFISGAQAAFDWLAYGDRVTVAAVQGHAIGAGFQLALACDLRVVTEDVRFRMAETSLGLVPDLGGTKRLVSIVGLGRSLEACLTGRAIDATEARQWGLANAVVPTVDDLDPAIDQLTAVILAAPAGAVTETKALLTGAADRTSREQLASERSAQRRRLQALAADLTPPRGE